MALKSNRVGVRTDQVDVYGRVTSKSFLQSILDHLPRWTSLKVWKNGTEQLLPVNTDEPVTSPIVADIQYPTDSSATEQMFTYRKSPTDADGEAYIQSIKGNTIVWNQIVNDVQAKSEVYGITRTKVTDGNKIGLQYTGTSESTQNFTAIFSLPFVVGHKYLCTLGASLPTGTRISLSSTDRVSSIIITISTTVTFGLLITSGTTVDITTYPQAFDLTAMFGAGKEPTTVEQFTALFPLPYYQYDAGSLLSFNGTWIKTANADESEESTTTIPTDTYFPTGMKRAGTVYDEFTSSRAYTRIGEYTFTGNETWSASATPNRFSITISDYLSSPIASQPTSTNAKQNVVSSKYGQFVYVNQDKVAYSYATSTGTVIVLNDSSLSTKSEVKTATTGMTIHYELAEEIIEPTLTFDEE